LAWKTSGCVLEIMVPKTLFIRQTNETQQVLPRCAVPLNHLKGAKLTIPSAFLYTKKEREQ